MPAEMHKVEILLSVERTQLELHRDLWHQKSTESLALGYYILQHMVSTCHISVGCGSIGFSSCCIFICFTITFNLYLVGRFSISL